MNRKERKERKERKNAAERWQRVEATPIARGCTPGDSDRLAPVRTRFFDMIFAVSAPLRLCVNY